MQETKKTKFDLAPTRPAVLYDHKEEDLEFMCIDIQMNYRSSGVTLYGVTVKGHSARLDVTFYPSICFKTTKEIATIDPTLIMDAIDKTVLNAADSAALKLRYGGARSSLQSVTHKKGKELIGYQTTEKHFLKISYNGQVYKNVDIIKQVLRNGIKVEGQMIRFYDQDIYNHVDGVMDYLLTTGVRCAGWIRVKKEDLTWLRKTRASQLYATCHWKKVTCDHERPDIAPLRVLSFDIECKGGRKDERGRFIFPEPQQDKVCLCNTAHKATETAT